MDNPSLNNIKGDNSREIISSAGGGILCDLNSFIIYFIFFRKEIERHLSDGDDHDSAPALDNQVMKSLFVTDIRSVLESLISAILVSNHKRTARQF